MIIIFISLTFVLLSYSLFSFSYAVEGINRLVINAPRSIFEYCVIPGDRGTPYYEQEEIKSRYTSYIDTRIHQYVDKYTIDYRFYNPQTGGICEDDCQGVEVKISSSLNFSFNYVRTMYYEITEVKNG